MYMGKKSELAELAHPMKAAPGQEGVSVGVGVGVDVGVGVSVGRTSEDRIPTATDQRFVPEPPAGKAPGHGPQVQAA